MTNVLLYPHLSPRVGISDFAALTIINENSRSALGIFHLLRADTSTSERVILVEKQ